MRVLHAIHDFLPRHRAGSEIYAFDLCSALLPRVDAQVLCAEYDPTRAHGTVSTRSWKGVAVHEVVNNWAFASFSESWASPTLHRAFEAVLDTVRPDLLHIHNLLNLSLELPLLAKRRGVRSVATLHDYTLVCPSGGQRVHAAEDHVCTSIDSARCARCFPQSPFHGQMAAHAAGPLWPVLVRLGRVARRVAPRATGLLERAHRLHPAGGLTPADIDARLSAAHAVFDTVELFVAPSPALGSEYVKLGLPGDRLEVSDYGFPSLAHQGPVPRGGPVRIGFVGTLSEHKGVAVLVEACRQLPVDRYRLILNGSLGTFPAYVAQLKTAARGLPVEFRGGFTPEDKARVYGELDVLVVPSLWPENSPLVIHEAFQAGVPVVGAAMGGIVDLLDHGKVGPLYEARSPSSLAGVLRELVGSPPRLAVLAAGLPKVKSLREDARGWEARYARAVAGKAREVAS